LSKFAPGSGANDLDAIGIPYGLYKTTEAAAEALHLPGAVASHYLLPGRLISKQPGFFSHHVLFRTVVPMPFVDELSGGVDMPLGQGASMAVEQGEWRIHGYGR